MGITIDMSPGQLALAVVTRASSAKDDFHNAKHFELSWLTNKCWLHSKKSCECKENSKKCTYIYTQARAHNEVHTKFEGNDPENINLCKSHTEPQYMQADNLILCAGHSDGNVRFQQNWSACSHSSESDCFDSVALHHDH